MSLFYFSTNIYLIQKTDSDHDGGPDSVAVIKLQVLKKYLQLHALNS